MLLIIQRVNLFGAQKVESIATGFGDWIKVLIGTVLEDRLIEYLLNQVDNIFTVSNDFTRYLGAYTVDDRKLALLIRLWLVVQ